MELNSMLRDMGLVDAFSTTLSEDIQPVDGTGSCDQSCRGGCSDSCKEGCSTSTR
jgi:hypothetical protein